MKDEEIEGEGTSKSWVGAKPGKLGYVAICVINYNCFEFNYL
jgi:hypothetical protein